MIDCIALIQILPLILLLPVDHKRFCHSAALLWR